MLLQPQNLVEGIRLRHWAILIVLINFSKLYSNYAVA